MTLLRLWNEPFQRTSPPVADNIYGACFNQIRYITLGIKLPSDNFNIYRLIDTISVFLRTFQLKIDLKL